MEHTSINYTKKIRANLYIISALILFMLLFLLVLTMPAQATEDVYGAVYNNTVAWNWSDVAIGHISVDGVYVYGFVPNTTDYQNTFTDKLPTAHKLVIYEGTTWGTLENVGENVSTTKGEPTTEEDLNSTLYKYIWLIIGIVLIITGTIIRRNEPNLIAGLIAFIGLGVIGNDLIGQIVYIVLLVIAFYTSFEGI